ncbi:MULTISPECIES: GreA/GreB family elongation factor [Paraburkholderia]|uniref:GreA/GreB family elongation factor n=1 Tax=Paraburkholderia tropica TaxID=92647 RepID=A0A1A5XDZ3_9BURK|nr:MULTISPECIES: GreA/GreB family elongation factor [Paraburkholderia]MBB2981242.1 regulator of nucleoside diphosphate kinase [Paraburkholderia tropica]MBB2999759.1 regulator of nucleoside diphosphate kinase [Paraburkholderia tropica]MBB6318164.1 regulator of nucleoside diphosphate kinase [Paraburkholderia tropica]MDE1141493.1 GreA/GreB family elongation factor [Paraburkholderia tropica]OBR51544.1 transcription elongation factor GreAB [Paraburkholderia tropica]
MSKKIRYLTELDLARLEKCAAEPGAAPARQAMLDELLERAEIVDAHKVASNVVTMNSQVTLVSERSGEPVTFTVVYPAGANVEAGRLNVFSPAGLALLGAKRGDTVRFTPPSGAVETLKIDRILFQPEAADDFSL